MSKQIEQHVMVLDETYPSGAQEWYCPLCERRLLVMNWHPDSRQIIIKNGDEASHFTTDRDNFVREDENGQTILNDEDLKLEIWESWMDEVDFDSWWNGPIN